MNAEGGEDAILVRTRRQKLTAWNPHFHVTCSPTTTIRIGIDVVAGLTTPGWVAVVCF